jgi:ParB-like chromosome segregation protein Spo0J
MSRTPQPLDTIKWVHRDTLNPNNYNPNFVAPPELKLLKISISEDGWTQPIVITENNVIVDGFHRWKVSGDPMIYKLTDGYVPTVTILATAKSNQQMATIRHNRARGTHAVLNMSAIVSQMVDDGLTGQEIMGRLGMEKEEVTRLLFRAGIPQSKVFTTASFSQAWTPK